MGSLLGFVHKEPIISTLNARLCASLPSISPCLTAVEVSAMSTSPHNKNVTEAGFRPLPSQVYAQMRSYIQGVTESPCRFATPAELISDVWLVVHSFWSLLGFRHGASR